MSTLSLFDTEPRIAEPRARRTDPDTSHMAAELATVNAKSNRMMCLRSLVEHGAATDFELADRLNVQQTSIGKRRGELRDAGLVEAVRDTKRCTPSGAWAQVWTATAAGRQYLNDGESR